MEVKVDSGRIKLERENRGWSQSHLASVAGLSLRTIQRIEKTGSASFESVTALASVFSIEVTDLRAREVQPIRHRAIRISLELPIRLVLAVISGTLCAVQFRWRGLFGFGDWTDFLIAGAFFGLAVLCPYLQPGRRLAVRAIALIGASALSYFFAFWTAVNAGEQWFLEGGAYMPYMIGSCVGVAIVLVATRFLIPLRVTATFWLLGVVASLAGGAVMYVGLEVWGDKTWSAIVGYCGWHVLACLAIYRGHRSGDAKNGLLAAVARTRGRFSIVPGWMSFRRLRFAGQGPAPVDAWSRS